ncbi:MAG TPA: amidohydrolase family protein, partial [Gemmatimonadaceae bacterium]|nr:amidohydrolase family protein [Gemmatimonadaceae bacterium]
TITNVSIIDGTGSPAYTGAVRFIGDSIVLVGPSVSAAPNDSVVDGKGLTLAPGFIDTHSHHDDGILRTPDALAVVSQGITTIIAGQDGSHPLPLESTLDSLGATPPAVNVAFYVGHGTLRSAVMGDDFKRKATAGEVDSMAALLRTELGAGGLGLSSGLEYDPGIYSDPSEVLALAKVTATLGGRYISHIRSEDRWFWQAVDEIIAIGREAKLPVQISHMKLGMIPLWGQADSLIHVLDRARASGVEITADVYPYQFWQSTLTVLYPNRDFENVAETEKILREIAKPEGLLLGAYAPNPAYAGKTVAEIAALRNERPSRTLISLIRDANAMRRERARAENGVVSGEVESVIATGMAEPDIAKILAWPHSNVCSDGMLDGPHPRGFGAFPRILGKYVREDHVLTLEDAVRKMTSLAADHAGLTRRGKIAPGNYADLVLFDPATVQDRSTPKEPHLTAAGIAQVWVNGHPVWRDGKVTGERPGRVLKRQSAASNSAAQ